MKPILRKRSAANIIFFKDSSQERSSLGRVDVAGATMGFIFEA